MERDLEKDGVELISLSKLLKKYGKDNHTIFTENSFFIAWVRKEKQSWIVENEPVQIEMDSLVFIKANSLIKFEKYDGNDWTLLFKPNFYEQTVQDSSLLTSCVFIAPQRQAYIIKIKTKEEREFCKLNILRVLSYQRNSDKIADIAIRNSIESLLLYAYRTSNEEHLIKDSVETTIIISFQFLLNKFHKKENSVAFYANRMAITPRKLAEATREAFDKSPKEMIVDKLIAESKKMLIYTQMNSSEISHSLNFSSEANFSNFFKKNTGFTPIEFRAEHRKK